MAEQAQPVANVVPAADEAGPASGPRRLSEAARRALAEAEARRQARDRATSAPPKEIDGRAGPDPVRYGDWETGGIASDF